MALGTRRKWPRPRRDRDVDNFSRDETLVRLESETVSRPRRETETTTLAAHIAALCRCGFYQLRQIRPAIRSLTPDAARTIVQAFIACRLDWCNSLLYGVPGNLLRKVSVRNAAARLLTSARRCDHITPLLRQLHWLPVQRRVEFKIACLVHQSLASLAPTYLTTDIHLVSRVWSSPSALIYR